MLCSSVMPMVRLGTQNLASFRKILRQQQLYLMDALQGPNLLGLGLAGV